MSTLLTIGQLAEQLQVHEQTLRQMIKDGRVTGIPVGKKSLRFRLDDVIEELRKTNAPETKEPAAI